METYDVNKNRYEDQTTRNGEKKKSVTLSLAKVFLYVAIGLFITTGVSYGWPYLLVAMTGGEVTDTTAILYYVAIIISLIYMLIAGIAISVKSFSKKTASVAVMYYIDTIAMGILCSSIFYVATEETINGVPIIAIAFGITAGAMLLAAGIAWLFRKTINKVWPFLTFLAAGLFVLTIVNIFVWPFNANAANMIYWIVDYALFALIFITIAIDMWRVGAMAKAGWLGDETNLAYYSAYTIYVDFIYILIKVIYYLLLASNKK